MSHILDALKKLEKESSRADIRGQAGTGTTVLLSGGAGQKRQKRLRLVLPAVVLLAAAGVVSTSVFHRPLQKQAPLPLPAQPAGVQTPAPLPPAVPPVLSAQPAPLSRASTSPAGPLKPVPQQQPVQPAVTPPADIRVMGIAWQDERRERRAVVNGFLVREGESISGARLSEIMTDRVRFSTPAGVFEVPLGSPAMQQGGR